MNWHPSPAKAGHSTRFMLHELSFKNPFTILFSFSFKSWNVLQDSMFWPGIFMVQLHKPSTGNLGFHNDSMQCLFIPYVIVQLCFSCIWGTTLPSMCMFKNYQLLVEYEVLTDIVMNVVIFWDIVPCSLYVNQRFWGTCHFHLQGQKPACSRLLGTCCTQVSCSAYIRPWTWWYIPPKCRLIYGLHGATF
jgi:hypothetical protein